MAVLDELGFEASILVNGKPLSEHNPIENPYADTERCVLKYVEVNESSRFRVRVFVPDSAFGVHEAAKLSFELDGHKRYLLLERKSRKPVSERRSDTQSQTCNFDRVRYRRDGQLAHVYFKFAPLIITEDDDAEATTMARLVSKLGEITVSLVPIEWARTPSPSAGTSATSRSEKAFSYHEGPSELPPNGNRDIPIPERKLKGQSMSQRIIYEEELEALPVQREKDTAPSNGYEPGSGGGRRDGRQPEKPKQKRWNTLKGHEGLGKLIFRYRSHDDLIKQGILPRPPEPEDSPDESSEPAQDHDVKIDAMDAEQLRALVRHQRDTMRGIKREAEDEGRHGSRQRSFAPSETIVLSDDDDEMVAEHARSTLTTGWPVIAHYEGM